MTDTLLPPTPLSLPDAAELPVVKKGFSRAAERRLLKVGITTALMLAEMASCSSGQLMHLTWDHRKEPRR